MSYNRWHNVQTWLAWTLIQGDSGLEMECCESARMFSDDEAISLIRGQVIARFDFGHSDSAFAHEWGAYVDWKEIADELRRE